MSATIDTVALPGAKVSDHTVVQLATQAVREVTGVGPDVRVAVHLTGDSVALDVWLPVRYPMPVWQVAAACRTNLAEQMRTRAGLTVRRIDIEVTELGPVRGAR